ncbi:hypothetical protein F4777DRAFT_580161 [Nemania sp. FL0916]|nr:hypothetical protein F4777DRAFT_580161 [Nemania sp. FL0916]
MESAIPRKDVREHLHRRALSQASTASSTMHSPKTTKSTSTSSSYPRATTPSNGPHTHRPYHIQAEREPWSTKQPPHLSREPSSDLKQPMTPVSSLLQERLQQERRAESERLASRADHNSSNSSLRDSDLQNLSGRKYKPATERRPGSSCEDDSSQNNMGAKQIEKAVSTLHKQNFDLKLELFHRREKQSALESRVEELESEQREMTDIHENLLAELIKRDKAIEEAVNMIVKLEAQLDELVREKEMVRQIEADGSYRHSWSNLSDSLRAETPKPSDHGVALSVEPKTLDRMPSFLSEQSAHTQHLRSVVLQSRSSLRHIRKVSEVSASSAEVSEMNRVASPNLSILSESSFVSIYGSKQEQDRTALPPLDHVSGMDGTFGTRSPTPTKRTTMRPVPIGHTSSPRHPRDLPSRPATSLPRQTIPENSVSRRDAPIPKWGKPNETANSVNHAVKPPTSGYWRSVVTPTPLQEMSKRERRNTLQKVVTHYPTQKELAHSHALPPTPDTVSSSVLRKHNDPSSSEDSLPRSDDTHTPTFVTLPLPQSIEYSRPFESRDIRPSANAQKTGSPAFHGDRPGLSTSGFLQVDRNRLLSDLGDLARSAAVITTARRSRSDSFVSDSDSDGGADARSDSESCDYWMRESYKPEKDHARSSTRRECRRAPSPDLFSFPVDSQGWQPDAMFGALKGGGFLGSPVPGLKRDPTDEPAPPIQSSRPGSPEPAANGPQPPSRRSSLNAQAAGQFLLSTLTGRTGRGPPREDDVVQTEARGRSNSIDGSGFMVPSKSRADAGPAKRSQYPPIVGLQSRARGLGINTLFRRSGHDNFAAPSGGIIESSGLPSAPPPGSSILPAHSRHVPKPSGRSSVPPPAMTPWAMRPPYVVEDERTGATPPPIMRNRVPAPQARLDPTKYDITPPEMLHTAEEGASSAAPPVAVETTTTTTTSVAPSGGGGMRKWLGLGKKAGLKDRSG